MAPRHSQGPPVCPDLTHLFLLALVRTQAALLVKHTAPGFCVCSSLCVGRLPKTPPSCLSHLL